MTVIFKSRTYFISQNAINAKKKKKKHRQLKPEVKGGELSPTDPKIKVTESYKRLSTNVDLLYIIKDEIQR